MFTEKKEWRANKSVNSCLLFSFYVVCGLFLPPVLIFLFSVKVKVNSDARDKNVKVTHTTFIGS